MATALAMSHCDIETGSEECCKKYVESKDTAWFSNKISSETNASSLLLIENAIGDATAKGCSSATCDGRMESRVTFVNNGTSRTSSKHWMRQFLLRLAYILRTSHKEGKRDSLLSEREGLQTLHTKFSLRRDTFENHQIHRQRHLPPR